MRSKQSLSLIIGSICVAMSSTALGQNNEPSVAELWEIVQRQQQELELLREELDSARNQTQTVVVQALENSERIEAVGEVLDSPQSRGSSWTDRTTIGAYGEVLCKELNSNGLESHWLSFRNQPAPLYREGQIDRQVRSLAALKT